MSENNKRMVGLIGNPNSGKTSLFNDLTGSNVKVGNWPGVTVEQKVGHFKYNGIEVELVDLPGTYALSRSSLDENVASDFLIGIRSKNYATVTAGAHAQARSDSGRGGFSSSTEEIEVMGKRPDAIINIIDSSNFDRNMYLTTLLIEMGIPVVVVLNMIDNARDKNIIINAKQLEEELGVPVIETIADIGKGGEVVKKAVTGELRIPKMLKYNDSVENAIGSIENLLDGKDIEGLNHRWIAVNRLEKDQHINSMIEERASGFLEKSEQIIADLEKSGGEDSDILITDARYSLIDTISKKVQKKEGRLSKTLSDKIDNVVLNRLIGVPLFLFVLYALFWISTEVAGAAIDFMDQVFNGGTLLWWDFDGIIPILQGVFGEGTWLDIILFQGVLGGVGTVLTFIPILYLVFLIMGFLEDFGYMARAASVMDRFMRMLGLPGKAFISFVLGFGCTVPAIMSTRTIEDEDERWLTAMLVPYMSCGARLPVYAFFGAVFFASWGGSLTFSIYIIGILLAVIVGVAFKMWRMRGKEASMFVIELPPYRMPSVKNVMITVWERVWAFFKNAGILVTIVVAVLTILANVPLYTPENATEDYEFQPNSRESLLGTIGEGVGYMFKPLGFGEVQSGAEKGKVNWRAGVSVFTGLFAKEAIVGTFGALYNLGEEVEAPEFPEAPELSDDIASAIADVGEDTDPAKLNEVIAKLDEHLADLPEDDYSAEITAYKEGLEASRDWKELEGHIGNDFSAFTSYMFLLFVLLYTPCLVVIGATYREFGAKWAAFQAIFQFVFAYVVVLIISMIGHAFFV